MVSLRLAPPGAHNPRRVLLTRRTPCHVAPLTLLCTGSYGSVREAVWDSPRGPVRVAIKQYRLQRMRFLPGGAQRVQREIDMLQHLRHRNIVSLLDSWSRGDKS